MRKGAQIVKSIPKLEHQDWSGTRGPSRHGNGMRNHRHPRARPKVPTLSARRAAVTTLSLPSLAFFYFSPSDVASLSAIALHLPSALAIARVPPPTPASAVAPSVSSGIPRSLCEPRDPFVAFRHQFSLPFVYF